MPFVAELLAEIAAIDPAAAAEQRMVFGSSAGCLPSSRPRYFPLGCRASVRAHCSVAITVCILGRCQRRHVLDIVGLQHVPSDDYHHLPRILFRRLFRLQPWFGGRMSGLWCECNILTKSARLPISVIRARRIFSSACHLSLTFNSVR